MIADAEAAWLGAARPGILEALHKIFDDAVATGCEIWCLSESALWLTLLKQEIRWPHGSIDRIPVAHRLLVTGFWQEAALAWRDQGCRYEHALALSLGDEAAQRDALACFDELGAHPAARIIRRILRKGGARNLPVGPQTARRNHPAGLTNRQNQVLELLAQGLSNAQIGERLGTSSKTAEHHVGAVLAALNASSRLEAVHLAHERGLLLLSEN